jgi:hypothetical protein
MGGIGRAHAAARNLLAVAYETADPSTLSSVTGLAID